MGRNTHQKQTVLSVLGSMRGQHPTAEMVYDNVVQVIPSISRATVYRILNQFAEQGVVTQLHIPDSADRYDDYLAPHAHLYCKLCKQIVHLVAPKFTQIPLPQEDASGCQITGVELTFLGICSRCLNKSGDTA